MKAQRPKIKLAQGEDRGGQGDRPHRRTEPRVLHHHRADQRASSGTGSSPKGTSSPAAGNTTLLTTIVAVEKMDVGVRRGREHAPALAAGGPRRQDQAGRRQAKIPVEAGLSVHGTAYPLKGSINFVNNQVDPKTGTIRFKARFDNPKPAAGQRVLCRRGCSPASACRSASRCKSMLVPDAAFGSDQGSRFLYVVGTDNKAVRLRR